MNETFKLKNNFFKQHQVYCEENYLKITIQGIIMC